MAQTTYSTTDLQGATLSGGNLTVVSANSTGTNYVLGVNADGKSSGKYYVEWLTNAVAGTNTGVGFVRLDSVRTAIGSIGDHAAGQTFKSGTIWVNGVNSGSQTGLAMTAGTYTYGAIDLDNKRVWFKKAGGNWNNNASNDPATNVGGADISALVTSGFVFVPATSLNASGDGFTMNTGATAYNGTKPTGFNTWDTNAVAPSTSAVFTQAGVEFWYDIPSQAWVSQVGLEVWRSIDVITAVPTFSARFVERV